MFAELLIRWTARLAVACYLGRLFCEIGGGKNVKSRRGARWWWTIGCAWFVLHVVAAFHFEHQWSHSAAFAFTAKRTLELTGWNSGWGLYINDVFLGLWIIDTVLWWRNLDWPTNPQVYWTTQAIFAFLIVQATAVFGPPFWRPVLVVVLLLMIGLAIKTGPVRVTE